MPTWRVPRGSDSAAELLARFVLPRRCGVQSRFRSNFGSIEFYGGTTGHGGAFGCRVIYSYASFQHGIARGICVLCE